jgi:NitT/TauT family transport system substrate-binding protein
MSMMLDRRQLLTALSLAGAASVVCSPPVPAAERPPETTTVRLAKKIPILCNAPQYIAEDLLRAEGFTDIQYIASEPGAALTRKISDGAIDFSMSYAGPNIIAIDAGEGVVNLAGVHIGCFELLGHGDIRSITDLKGKSIGITALGSSEHVYLAAMLAYIGLDPHRDVHWVTSAFPPVYELFTDKKVDAFLGFAPTPQDLRARRVGHVVVNSAVDRPWSQYFCCMLIGNRDYVRKYPIATKRVLRAILKAADHCATEPATVARRLVDSGFSDRYDYALQGLSELPYDKWREYDPEDTIRFYALRLHEIGMIKSTPQKIIAYGTDWRFLNELKHELKA